MCLKNLFNKRKPSCSHNWEEVHRYIVNVYEPDGKKNGDLPIANHLTIELKCKNCGDIKFQKIDLTH